MLLFIFPIFFLYSLSPAHFLEFPCLKKHRVSEEDGLELLCDVGEMEYTEEGDLELLCDVGEMEYTEEELENDSMEGIENCVSDSLSSKVYDMVSWYESFLLPDVSLQSIEGCKLLPKQFIEGCYLSEDDIKKIWVQHREQIPEIVNNYVKEWNLQLGSVGGLSLRAHRENYVRDPQDFFKLGLIPRVSGCLGITPWGGSYGFVPCTLYSGDTSLINFYMSRSDTTYIIVLKPSYFVHNEYLEAKAELSCLFVFPWEIIGVFNISTGEFHDNEIWNPSELNSRDYLELKKYYLSKVDVTVLDLDPFEANKGNSLLCIYSATHSRILSLIRLDQRGCVLEGKTYFSITASVPRRILFGLFSYNQDYIPDNVDFKTLNGFTENLSSLLIYFGIDIFNHRQVCDFFSSVHYRGGLPTEAPDEYFENRLTSYDVFYQRMVTIATKHANMLKSC